MSGRVDARVIVFLALVVVLLGGLVAYTLRRQPPLLPADLDHRRAATPDACLSCHGPGQKNARDANHPLNDQCFNCHERG